MDETLSGVFEYKSTLADSLKDVDKSKRQMVGKFADYQTYDLVGDLSHKGMFDRTWKENKHRVKHLYEHDTTKVIGKISELWDDNEGAYYKSTVGTHKFGNDILDMADAGLLNEHSFGYVTKRSTKSEKGGRNLLEVMHLEVTNVGGGWAVHGNTPMLSVTKTMQLPDLIEKMKARYKALDKFCRNSEASDDTIELLLLEVKQLQQNIIDLSISSTPVAEQAPESPKGLHDENYLLVKAAIENTKIKILTPY